MKNKHSSGDDNIPASIVKLCAKEISEILCYIINNSLKYGIFPASMKTALIKPLYKKGNSQEFDNYRPISMLPSFSKLFEMVVGVRMVNFMNSCKLFVDTQHGYIKGRSTITAVYQFVQRVLESLEEGNLALGLFLDLSKAYDCLNHELLLTKLEKYGIRGNANKWIRSYLTNRQQKVAITRNEFTATSGARYNCIGIPQGSILGPVLFVIYMNDINNCSSSITNYADDTSLLIKGKSLKEIEVVSEQVFPRVTDWFAQNHLLVNQTKTKLILFRTKQKQLDTPPAMAIAGNMLQLQSASEFLGLSIDEFLDWAPQVDKMCLKLSSVCFGLRSLCSYLNGDSLRTIYLANFESLMRYGIVFWGRGCNLQRVFVIQKRAVRLMNKMCFRDSCRGTFRGSKIMTAYALYIYECLMFMFRNRDKFPFNSEHNYNVRDQCMYYPIHRLTLTEKSPYYTCIKLYNYLPSDLKKENNLFKFKKKLKEILVVMEPYTLNDFLNAAL